MWELCSWFYCCWWYSASSQLGETNLFRGITWEVSQRENMLMCIFDHTGCISLLRINISVMLFHIWISTDHRTWLLVKWVYIISHHPLSLHLTFLCTNSAQMVDLDVSPAPRLPRSRAPPATFSSATWWSWHTIICRFTSPIWQNATGTFTGWNWETQVILLVFFSEYCSNQV